ncbi:lysophospholipid acyltransferase family protein [Salipiger mucosus]|uniref:1-acyl-sn-glycerol-3-phosphate acyltransferase n=1 Tax=Salipiger mucosus DSM 16094 TaxID=1123237 RepID=S9QQK6_9RHOB|nr:lysophospholipid acyltransferase family protein [Salipiger mucosus]EPX83671.1 1-acyl-sn-glycerol-3-phosphate acyltransferase [Salipiger mucosus DSM 16094]
MSEAGPTWQGDEMTPPRPGPAGWLLVVPRALLMLAAIGLGVVVMVPLRVIERPIHGEVRPWTPHITRAVSRSCLAIMGIGFTVRGPRMRGPGAVVANHSSWLDIFALNARKTVYFVSKAEVSGWPLVGGLARLVGTVFITRERRDAAAQTALFERRLLHGHRLLFFPEGTSSDGIRVLPFKSTLFQAFFVPELKHEIQVQAVTVIYHPPPGQDPRFYGWWGGMSLADHLLAVLGRWRQGGIELVYHAPVRVDAHPNRKSLARHLEEQVRAAHPGTEA